MPQPMRPPSSGQDDRSISFGPNVVLRRPELAAQIGNIIANWTLVEGALLDLYALMMGDYLTPSRPGWAPPHHPVARQVFEKVQSFNARLDLVHALCKWRGTAEETERFANQLRKQLKSAYASRNSIAHDGWGVCDTYPDALILSRIHGLPLIYKKPDFERISEAICDARKATGKLHHEMYHRRYKPQQE